MEKHIREVLFEYWKKQIDKDDAMKLLRGDDAKLELLELISRGLVAEYYMQLLHKDSYIYDGVDPLLKK